MELEMSSTEAMMQLPELIVTTGVVPLLVLALSSRAQVLNNSEVELVEQQCAEGSNQR
jgi:hypothetical protein